MFADRREPLPIVLESLSLSGFRNLFVCTLTPGARFNVLFGDNGAGKSSLLEAIGYLAALAAFATPRRRTSSRSTARRRRSWRASRLHR